MSKIILLAPSAGGKSSLMRYFRSKNTLNVREMDEEVLRVNRGKWPEDNDYKDKVLVPQIVQHIIQEQSVLYLASYVPDELLKKAKDNDFKIILLEISLNELNRRNKARMKTENYADASEWLQIQLDTFARLKNKGLINKVIDGELPTKNIAALILQ